MKMKIYLLQPKIISSYKYINNKFLNIYKPHIKKHGCSNSVENTEKAQRRYAFFLLSWKLH